MRTAHQIKELKIVFNYDDAKEKKCKHVSYSSGVVPAPFKTIVSHAVAKAGVK